MTEENAFESILNREFRWPKAGDRPFAQSQNWQDNAYIDPHGHGRLMMMMTGYKKAADLMVERAIADDGDRSSLVCPFIFNYRQLIELSLKYLISTYGHAVGVDAIWNTHDLGDLWKALMTVLNGYGHQDVDGTDPTVAQIVAEFAKDHRLGLVLSIDGAGRLLALHRGLEAWSHYVRFRRHGHTGPGTGSITGPRP